MDRMCHMLSLGYRNLHTFLSVAIHFSCFHFEFLHMRKTACKRCYYYVLDLNYLPRRICNTYRPQINWSCSSDFKSVCVSITLWNPNFVILFFDDSMSLLLLWKLTKRCWVDAASQIVPLAMAVSFHLCTCSELKDLIGIRMSVLFLERALK